MALTINDILPEPRERIFICGKTGSGKTTLAEYICRSFPYVVCFDAKRMLGINPRTLKRVGWLEYKRVKSFSELLKNQNEKKLIYVPTPAELRDDKIINAFFEFIYTRGNTVCYVDELTSVTDRSQLPPFYFDCLVRGRELGISMFQSSQRPMDVPTSCIESSERYYVFKVKMPQDVKRVREVTGLDYDFCQLPKREFFYVTEEGEQRGPLILNLEGEGK